jgi:hypothetical protein
VIKKISKIYKNIKSAKIISKKIKKRKVKRIDLQGKNKEARKK